LEDYGFRVIIASSFADIFFNNCFKNGLLPIRLAADRVDELFKAVAANAGYKLTVDLEKQSISAPDGKVYKFEVEAFRKHCLLNGLDDIGLTLQHVEEIKTYEAKHRLAQPWLFA
jgi:3-isopropylmalate/(R)-2-methylmalate dehydratase small subunit